VHLNHILKIVNISNRVGTIEKNSIDDFNPSYHNLLSIINFYNLIFTDNVWYLIYLD